jgi:hypothetical protein
MAAKSGSVEKTCQFRFVDHERKPSSEVIEREPRTGSVALFQPE